MSTDFLWGLLALPALVSAGALASAAVVAFWWIQAKCGGEAWKVGGKYPTENIAAVAALAPTVRRVLYIPGLYVIRTKREGLRDAAYGQAVRRLARVVREEVAAIREVVE